MLDLAGISFKIPRNYTIDIRNSSEDCFRLIPPEADFILELRAERDIDGTEAELQSILEDMEPVILRPVSPLTLNGLSGHHAVYSGRRFQYYAAWLTSLPSAALSITVTSEGNILDMDTAALLAALDPKSLL